jgi:hypothetical protein
MHQSFYWPYHSRPVRKWIGFDAWLTGWRGTGTPGWIGATGIFKSGGDALSGLSYSPQFTSNLD